MTGMRRMTAIASTAAILAAAVGLAAAWAGPGTPSAGKLPVPSAARAYGYLQKICRIGPRYSGSRGMTEQQALLAEHFVRLGARVAYQSFDAADPLTGEPVRMSNLIVTWDPKSTERVLIGCHYDTRPFPDRDRNTPRGIFVGANDGASGVALLMELGHLMARLPVSRGVDFVFFDGEELVVDDRGKYFLGSTHFATEYRDHPPAYRYAAGVLIDMIGDRDLDVFQEKSSLRLAPGVTHGVWAAAKAAGVREFHRSERHEVNDDHLPLNEIARIPTCDVIDFDYPYWHTSLDRPDRCSGESLAKVGRVLIRWLSLPAAQQGP